MVNETILKAFKKWYVVDFLGLEFLMDKNDIEYSGRDQEVWFAAVEWLQSRECKTCKHNLVQYAGQTSPCLTCLGAHKHLSDNWERKDDK